MGSTNTSNIPGTLAKFCWNSTGISNCIVSRSWLGALFTSITDGIGLSNTSISNRVVDVNWLGASSIDGTNNIVLLDTSIFNFAIDVGWWDTSSTDSANNVVWLSDSIFVDKMVQFCGAILFYYIVKWLFGIISNRSFYRD